MKFNISEVRHLLGIFIFLIIIFIIMLYTTFHEKNGKVKSDANDEIINLMQSLSSIHEICYANYCINENMTFVQVRQIVIDMSSHPLYRTSMLSAYDLFCSLK